MTDLLQLNLQVIQERWPDIAAQLQPLNIEELDAGLIEGLEQTIMVNGLQLSSRHARQREAELLCNTLPQDAKTVHLYGVGMGDTPIRLLETNRCTQLVVHLINPCVFKLLISYTNQSEWLSDPRVSLSIKPESDYPLLPNISITPELTLCDGDYACVRDLLVYEINREHVNQNRAKQIEQFKDRLELNLPRLQQHPDVIELLPEHANSKAIIVASGPSQEEAYSRLKAISDLPKAQRPLIIAVDTSCQALNQHGINPDIVVTVDELITPEIVDVGQSAGRALVYMAKSSPELIDAWQGPKFNAHSNLPRDDALASLLPKTRLFLNGSVVQPAIHLAILLGAKEITFVGVDFGYPGKKAYAFWQPGNTLVGMNSTDSPHWVLDGHGERLPTALNLRAYMRSLEHFIRKHPDIRFYRDSKSGAAIKGTEFRELSHD
ncbi:DUF115 domain-containing protein [Shewanella submarina]|uniref:Motility associated factor glycosyltransferase family protein n=1 Tax=Shewanella submarina TaxID=2016376 RepID=A0ABV7GGZ0_9GAMM|nr:6-hydroxymethylpterin diphosphokinase MptE-like protein [Shewanella submarina]MCL1036467.1 DUF115 domain-containing protein [Shewanella submarina]